VINRLLAQATTFSVESVGSQIGLGGADLRDTTINIIQWVLGILALVAVAMIIFSGFIAATAQESERADRARKTIVGALVGLVIVLLAWAIVLFVARTTSNVTA
jgi:MFS family permease